MFLEVTKRRNGRLLEFAGELHQQGLILPDTYVIDVDTVVENTKKIVETAKAENIELYYMTKQVGRNPYLSKRIVEAGIEKAVVVDFKEALVLMEAGLAIGNVGHLVQIPQALLAKFITYGVEFITVYSLEMLEKIQAVAQKLNVKQKVMLRIVEAGDMLYEGQYGGFVFEELADYIPSLKTFNNLEIAGITSFPCFLYDAEEGEFKAMKNVQTLLKSQKLLQEAGFPVITVNMPSATTSRSIPFISSIGGTQGEPGHALTGTTPMHAEVDLAEVPAMVYVSEISHNYKGKSYLYGGGYYRRSHLTNAEIINTDGSHETDTINKLNCESIDYYLELKTEHEVGATVLMAARTQIFVTRSTVALVEGLLSDEPRLVGLYDSQGREL